MAAFRIIVARAHVGERDAVLRCFADLPDCQVVVDRRVAERRRREPSRELGERRYVDRRSGHLETAGGSVLFIH